MSSKPKFKGRNRFAKTSRTAQQTAKKRNRQKEDLPIRQVVGEITDLGLNGDGLLTYIDHEMSGDAVTKTAFIPYTAIGDQGTFFVQGQHGWIDKIEKLSEHRVDQDTFENLCPHFGQDLNKANHKQQSKKCGGCAMQHLRPEFTAEWKADLIRQALTREGIDDVTIHPTKTSEKHSRRRAGLTIARAQDGKIRIGFNQKLSHHIVDLKDCHVLHPAIIRLKPVIADMAELFIKNDPRLRMTAFITVTEHTGEGGKIAKKIDVDLGGKFNLADVSPRDFLTLTELAGDHVTRLTVKREMVFEKEPMMVDLDGVKVELPPRGFLQATQSGQDTLQEEVRARIYANMPKRQSQKMLVVADLFAGCGTFTFELAKEMEVTAVDHEGEAIIALERAAKRLANDKTQTNRQIIKALHRDLHIQPVRAEDLSNMTVNMFDAVIFDPPRAGAVEQCQQLVESDVHNIVGVSCNPKTFARDAKILIDGGFELIDVQPVDQFLFSSHIELVAGFKRT